MKAYHLRMIGFFFTYRLLKVIKFWPVVIIMAGHFGSYVVGVLKCSCGVRFIIL